MCIRDRAKTVWFGFSSSTFVLSTPSALGMRRSTFSISIEIPPSADRVTGCSCRVGLTLTSLTLPFRSFLISVSYTHLGGHTGTYFSDLGSTQLGAIIHLETDWGNFTYKVTDMQVIQETDVDKVRWGAEEPSCILYTCYPFGILTHTPQRYAVYADPVSADEYGVVPAETTEK